MGVKNIKNSSAVSAYIMGMGRGVSVKTGSFCRNFCYSPPLRKIIENPVNCPQTYLGQLLSDFKIDFFSRGMSLNPPQIIKNSLLLVGYSFHLIISNNYYLNSITNKNIVKPASCGKLNS